MCIRDSLVQDRLDSCTITGSSPQAGMRAAYSAGQSTRATRSPRRLRRLFTTTGHRGPLQLLPWLGLTTIGYLRRRLVQGQADGAVVVDATLCARRLEPPPWWNRGQRTDVATARGATPDPVRRRARRAWRASDSGGGLRCGTSGIAPAGAS